MARPTATAAALVASAVGLVAYLAKPLTITVGDIDLRGPLVVVGPTIYQMSMRGGPMTGPNPLLLPVADGTDIGAGTYGRTLEAGQSYTDPVTGVSVYKVTDSDYPVSNVRAYHDYAGQGPEISLPWTSGGHVFYTLQFATWTTTYWLIDFNYTNRAFSNLRAGPVRDHDLGFSFSTVTSTPRIAYYLSGGVLNRYDTEANALANTGNFPHDPVASSLNDGQWLSHSVNDSIFGWHTPNGAYGVVWNAVTDTELWAYSASSVVNEFVVDYDGAYIYVSSNDATVKLDIVRTSDGANLGAPTDDRGVVHIAAGRSLAIMGDPDTSGGPAYYYVVPSNQTDEVFAAGGVWLDADMLVHNSGHWVQSNSSGLSQWFLTSPYVASGGANTGDLSLYISYVRPDGQARLVAWHDGVWTGAAEYNEIPFATSSPDGRLVMWNSNMNNSGRSDVFIAVVP